MKNLSKPPPPEEIPVLKQAQAGLCTLTLNRPQSYNALSLHCMETLLKELATWPFNRFQCQLEIAPNL